MLADLLAELQREAWYRGQLTHVETLPSAPAGYASIQLPPLLASYLERNGIRLYRHQAEAIEAFRSGRDVIITTPTASGKTLAFNIPILEALIEDDAASAIYVYPLKALANDQLGKLKAIEAGCGIELSPHTYDGDTPAGARGRIKRTARIVMTNVHALHQYLPWHHQWARIFSNLNAIVLDEAHRYRGVFGANVSLFLRRFLRIVEHYGGSPRIIISSAGIANPIEFAQALTGREAVLIDHDSSSRGEKSFLFWDPLKDPSGSITSQAARILSFLTGHGLQTICFTRSRFMAESVGRAARRLAGDGIASYRAGYLPPERRRLEEGLRSRKIKGIVSTSALESGIDIGGLDAAVIVGFPGSRLAAWQQAGRAGRRDSPSIVVYIPYENPLDRYFIRHPAAFLSTGKERLIIPKIDRRQRAGHIACAAAELPLREAELNEEEKEIVSSLCGEGVLAETSRGFIYRGLERAHQRFALDDLSGQTIKITCDGTVLETMDPLRARREAHPGAVLLHNGETYVIERLDLEKGIAEGRREDVPYHTHALVSSEVKILSTSEFCESESSLRARGRGMVTERVVGYKTIDADRTISVSDLDLPPHSYESDVMWISFRCGIPGIANADLPGSIHGAEHALLAMAPLLVLCDAGDVGGVSSPFDPKTGYPTIVFYDAFSGGAGITPGLYRSFSLLIEAAHALVSECPCRDGCPACILSPRCGSQNRPLSKPGTILILKSLTEEWGSR